MSFIISFFSIFSSCEYFVQQRGTILAILVERQPRNISVKLFLNLTTGLRGKVILRFFYFNLWWPSCSVEQNDFSDFGRGSFKEQFCETILKLGQWPRSEISFIGFFLLLALAAILFSRAERFEQFW